MYKCNNWSMIHRDTVRNDGTSNNIGVLQRKK